MKILNSTYRDVFSEESVLKTPISELAITTELAGESLIHIVHYIKENTYESKKMRINDFEHKVYEAVQNTFKVDYGDTHRHDKSINLESESSTISGSSFNEMIAYLGENKPTEPVFSQNDYMQDAFIAHINYDFEVIKRYIVKQDNGIKGDIKKINDKLIKMDYPFDPSMIITTTNRDNEVIHDSVNHKKTENDTYCQLEIKDGNKISNEWMVPSDGMLVVYGWLDSTDALNNKAIPSAFCVLEGKITSIDPTNVVDDTEPNEDSSDVETLSEDNTTSNGNWEILSVQSVIPAKSITYVGFTVPVHNGLTIRVRTGFTVGVKSGQYSNDNDGWDSLSNSTPNGFRCQVFSNSKYRGYRQS